MSRIIAAILANDANAMFVGVDAQCRPLFEEDILGELMESDFLRKLFAGLAEIIFCCFSGEDLRTYLALLRE